MDEMRGEEGKKKNSAATGAHPPIFADDVDGSSRAERPLMKINRAVTIFFSFFTFVH